jgi:hypothetical protein
MHHLWKIPTVEVINRKSAVKTKRVTEDLGEVVEVVGGDDHLSRPRKFNNDLRKSNTSILVEKIKRFIQTYKVSIGN